MRPHGRFHVNPRAPVPYGVCDRCGMEYKLSDLKWQYEFQGAQLSNQQLLVCTRTCLDKPAPFLQTIILPPDPVSVMNPRPRLMPIDDDQWDSGNWDDGRNWDGQNA